MPGCLNCSQRYIECVYESAPTARGPDRVPGGRRDRTKRTVVSARPSRIIQSATTEPSNTPDRSPSYPAPTTVRAPPVPTVRPPAGELLNHGVSLTNPQSPSSDSIVQRYIGMRDLGLNYTNLSQVFLMLDPLVEIPDPQGPRVINGEQFQHTPGDPEELGNVSISKPRVC